MSALPIDPSHPLYWQMVRAGMIPRPGIGANPRPEPGLGGYINQGPQVAPFEPGKAPQIPLRAMPLREAVPMAAKRVATAAQNNVFGVPAEVAAQMDPKTVKQLRAQALMQAGLGILAANERGSGLGGSLLFGMNQGQDFLGRGLGQAWAAQRSKREDERLDWYQDKSEKAEERQARLDRVAMSDRIRGRMNERERLEMERERLKLSQEAALRDGRLTPYQAETLRLQQEALGRERERERRVNELIKAQRKYKRGSDGWQLLQDEIDNVSGRSVDRSVGDGLGLDMGGAAAPDLSGFLKEEAPVQRPPPEEATAPAPAVAPQAGLGAPTRPLPEAAYRSVPEINAAITGGTARAVTKADNYTARLNQKLLAKMEGISWEEWRSRNGFPPP